jgi:hypothetical protein
MTSRKDAYNFAILRRLEEVMSFGYRSALSLAVLAVMVLGIWAAALAAPMEATISLGRDPEPPYCALNPDGTVDITWNIEHTTTPNYVYYKLEDPTRTIIYEDETYAGETGITVARQWTVPAGAPDGKYWIRVEYWSFEAGNEANAEVTFYVCSGTSDVCATKFQDMNCDNVISDGDVVVSDWWICIDTPLGDTFCQQTDSSGTVCWTGLPFGDYRIYEIMPGGWESIFPPTYSFTLGEEGQHFVFLNKLEGASATEPSSWGRIKGMFE